MTETCAIVFDDKRSYRIEVKRKAHHIRTRSDGIDRPDFVYDARVWHFYAEGQWVLIGQSGEKRRSKEAYKTAMEIIMEYRHQERQYMTLRRSDHEQASQTAL